MFETLFAKRALTCARSQNGVVNFSSHPIASLSLTHEAVYTEVFDP